MEQLGAGNSHCGAKKYDSPFSPKLFTCPFYVQYTRQQKCAFQESKAWVCICVFPFHFDSPSSDCYVLTSFPFHNTKPQPYNRCGRRCRRFSTGVDIRLAKKYMKTPAHNFKSERTQENDSGFSTSTDQSPSLRTIDTFCSERHFALPARCCCVARALKNNRW